MQLIRAKNSFALQFMKYSLPDMGQLSLGAIL